MRAYQHYLFIFHIFKWYTFKHPEAISKKRKPLSIQSFAFGELCSLWELQQHDWKWCSARSTDSVKVACKLIQNIRFILGIEKLHYNGRVNIFETELNTCTGKVQCVCSVKNQTFNSITSWLVLFKVTQWTLKWSNTCTQTGMMPDSSGVPSNWTQSWLTAMGNLFIYLSVKLWHAVLTSPYLC